MTNRDRADRLDMSDGEALTLLRTVFPDRIPSVRAISRITGSGFGGRVQRLRRTLVEERRTQEPTLDAEIRREAAKELRVIADATARLAEIFDV